MNTPTQQAEIDKQRQVELIALFAEWSKHPVTRHLVNHLQGKCNEQAAIAMRASMTPALSDAAVRQQTIILSSYSSMLSLVTNANEFVGIIPVTNKQ